MKLEVGPQLIVQDKKHLVKISKTIPDKNWITSERAEQFIDLLCELKKKRQSLKLMN